MPFAEFQAGNAGLALPQYQFQTGLQTLEAGMSMMDRAQRRRLAEEEMGMRREKHAADLVTSDLQQKSFQAEIGMRNIQLRDAERSAAELTTLRDQYAAAAPKITESLNQISRMRDPAEQRRLFNQLQSQAAIFQRDPNLRAVLDKQFAATQDTIAANETSNLAVAVANNLTAPDEATARQKFPGQALQYTVDPSTGIPVWVATGKPDPLMESRAMSLLSLADTEEELRQAAADPAVNMMLGAPGSRAAELYRSQRAKLREQGTADAEVDAKRGKAQYDMAVSMNERSVPGFEGVAPTKEEAIKFREQVSNNDQILSGVREIAELASKPGASVDPETRARISTVQAFLIGKLRLPMTGPGAFTDDERNFVRNTIGNPATIFSLGSVERSKLTELSTRLLGDIDTTAAGIGLRRKGKGGQGGAPVSGSRAQAIARGGAAPKTP